MRHLLITCAFALLAAGMAAQEKGNADAANMKNPVASTPESIAAGETIYRRRCTGCHGKDGSGGPPKVDPQLYAVDKATGKQVGAVKIPTRTSAPPPPG